MFTVSGVALVSDDGCRRCAPTVTLSANATVPSGVPRRTFAATVGPLLPSAPLRPPMVITLVALPPGTAMQRSSGSNFWPFCQFPYELALVLSSQVAVPDRLLSSQFLNRQPQRCRQPPHCGAVRPRHFAALVSGDGFRRYLRLIGEFLLREPEVDSRGFQDHGSNAPDCGNGNLLQLRSSD